MKTFDLQMKKCAQAEEMRLKPDAEERFREAMDEARIASAKIENAKPRRKNRLVWLVSAECIVAAVLLFALLPARDVTDQALIPQETQAALSAQMVPITQPRKAHAPQVRFKGVSISGEGSLYASFQNDTDDTWLVEWSAQRKGDEAQSGGLIWLEPGAECGEHFVWLDAGDEAEITARYRGLRVQDKVLHWMDGELLHPGEEGYAGQQSLMEDAFAAGALILAPGDWENGQAGAMRLLMPASWEAAHPEKAALDYYLEQGVLIEESALCSGEETLRLISLEEAR